MLQYEVALFFFCLGGTSGIVYDVAFFINVSYFHAFPLTELHN